MPQGKRRFSKEARRPRTYLSHVITITSETGVGSTTAINGLSERLGGMWRYVSGGGIMRRFAHELGMTIEAFAAHAREHPERGFDALCDKAMAEYGKQNYTVLEGRLPHVFVPHAFHVRLMCPYGTRAMRRYKDSDGISRKEVERRIRERDQNDRERYDKLYPGWAWPDSDFDCVVPTIGPPKYVVETILAEHARWQKKTEIRRVINLK